MGNIRQGASGLIFSFSTDINSCFHDYGGEVIIISIPGFIKRISGKKLI